VKYYLLIILFGNSHWSQGGSYQTLERCQAAGQTWVQESKKPTEAVCKEVQVK
jgi:hypothetical protein